MIYKHRLLTAFVVFWLFFSITLFMFWYSGVDFLSRGNMQAFALFISICSGVRGTNSIVIFLSKHE